MHIFCSEPFVLSSAPDANLILMLTRGARLGGATAQSPLGVPRYRPLGPFNIFFENDKITLEKFNSSMTRTRIVANYQNKENMKILLHYVDQATRKKLEMGEKS